MDRRNDSELIVAIRSDSSAFEELYPVICLPSSGSLLGERERHPEEQQELGVRLQDLGDIVFRRDDEPGPSPEEPFQEILLGPIVERPDGLRVEGLCLRRLCGTGAVYMLVVTEGGYEVTGTNDTYGSWIA